MRSSLIILAGIAAVQAAVAAPPVNGHLSAREHTVPRAEVDSPGGKDWKRAELNSPGGKDWKRAEVDSPGGKDWKRAEVDSPGGKDCLVALRLFRLSSGISG
ncbi:hypothetical protein FNAPI_13649 [Fusarium napiforme]|uniref:Uncharacterized protein n=1 Tax=Fusarium napiforme TaxID=42672 RepID=A0A8H5I604_9HYPO|nr:hypothetical protein FNAPI_13649 [Fusarium napiforme]